MIPGCIHNSWEKLENHWAIWKETQLLWIMGILQPQQIFRLIILFLFVYKVKEKDRLCPSPQKNDADRLIPQTLEKIVGRGKVPNF